MLDLNVDSKTHAAYGTVVASRVRNRSDLLILRPFPLWLFQRGATEGPALLLRKLRGEHIDWETLQEARWPRARCQECRELRSLDLYAYVQWDRLRANRGGSCLACQRGAHNQTGPLRRNINAQAALAKSVVCSRCHFTKVEEAFPKAQLAQADADAKRQCSACRLGTSQLNCTACNRRKPAKDFRPSMRTMPDDVLTCMACSPSNIATSHWFSCKACGESFPKAARSAEDGSTRARSCLNCSRISSSKHGWRTCRNSQCNKRFEWTDGKRCPACSCTQAAKVVRLEKK